MHLPPFLMDMLAKHKNKQAEHIAEVGELRKPGDFPNLVFAHSDGSHYSQPTVRKKLQAILQKAGLGH